jgi:UDP-N-acetylmuramyl tripeptide synthase
MVLLLGKGHEEFQLIKGIRYPFSEREIVLRFSKVQPILSKKVV